MLLQSFDGNMWTKGGFYWARDTKTLLSTQLCQVNYFYVELFLHFHSICVVEFLVREAMSDKLSPIINTAKADKAEVLFYTWFV